MCLIWDQQNIFYFRSEQNENPSVEKGERSERERGGREEINDHK